MTDLLGELRQGKALELERPDQLVQLERDIVTWLTPPDLRSLLPDVIPFKDQVQTLLRPQGFVGNISGITVAPIPDVRDSLRGANQKIHSIHSARGLFIETQCTSLILDEPETAGLFIWYYRSRVRSPDNAYGSYNRSRFPIKRHSTIPVWTEDSMYPRLHETMLKQKFLGSAPGVRRKVGSLGPLVKEHDDRS